MIAPIVIASVESAAWMWRYRFVRRFLLPWLLVCAYVTNIAWSPSPISANEAVWGSETERHEVMREALGWCPTMPR